MPLNLDQPLSWKNAHAATSPDAAAELAMLNDLQGNILKGHGRDYTSNLFVSFDRSKQSAARQFVRSVGGDVNAALDQFLKAEAFRKSGVSGGTFIAFMLTSKGYDALGRLDAKPANDAFDAGMAQRALGDPTRDKWEPQFAKEIHALILIGCDNKATRDAERDKMVARIEATGGAVTLLNPAFGEDGNSLRNAAGNGLEHFGYVDGVSQPLAVSEDIDAAKAAAGAALKWDPEIPLSQLLVACPGGKHDVSYGSYFVFRKLEQNVRAFKTREEALSRQLEETYQLPDESVDVGASVVGRFENGMPFALEAEEGTVTGAPGNNFDFSDDPQGKKCPFAAHIRKSNPRSDIDGSKAHLMARRGIPYGVRTDDPNDDKLDNKPTGNVGLLFMAYQRDIANQFEFAQKSWVNNPHFRNAGLGGVPGPVIDPRTALPVQPANPTTGIDPVIGQPAGSSGQRWTIEWDKRLSDGGALEDFSGFVTMKGGEYFFAPSITFLKSL
jgi:Dyp-type peroxidase family